MSQVQAFFVSLMDNFMRPSKPVTIFPMASDTDLMTENKPSEEDNKSKWEDKREYYVD